MSTPRSGVFSKVFRNIEKNEENPCGFAKRQQDFNRISKISHSQILIWQQNVGVSNNRGTPKSSILIGFSIINHPFWGAPIFGNTHVNSSKISTGIPNELEDFPQLFFSLQVGEMSMIFP